MWKWKSTCDAAIFIGIN